MWDVRNGTSQEIASCHQRAKAAGLLGLISRMNAQKSVTDAVPLITRREDMR